MSQFFNTCGCGKPVRYEGKGFGSCNKYARCKKPYHGWEWSCRLLSDGRYQICLFLRQRAWLNDSYNTYWITGYAVDAETVRLEVRDMGWKAENLLR